MSTPLVTHQRLALALSAEEAATFCKALGQMAIAEASAAKLLNDNREAMELLLPTLAPDAQLALKASIDNNVMLAEALLQLAMGKSTNIRNLQDQSVEYTADEASPTKLSIVPNVTKH